MSVKKRKRKYLNKLYDKHNSTREVTQVKTTLQIS